MYSRQKVKEIKVEGTPPELYPMTSKRQKILDQAMDQLRKSRAAMDPGILKKIRRMVASSPDIMKKLGLTEEMKPAEPKQVDTAMPLSEKQPNKPVQEKPKQKKSFFKRKFKETPKKEKQKFDPKEYEEVDLAKTMEIMAKLMTINPDAKENIKSAIKKAGE